MTNCRNCGMPVYPGNTRVIVRKGKRKQREHVSCEKAREKYARSGSMAVAETSEPEQIQNTEPEPVLFRDCSASMEHDGHESLNEIEYRFFLHPASVEKLKRGLKKADAWVHGFASNWSLGIQVEIIPVLESVVEANPEVISELIEVKIDGEIQNNLR